jgi:hypothetical protein
VTLFTNREFTTDSGQVIELTAGHRLSPGANRRQFERAYCYTEEEQDGGRFTVGLGDLQHVDDKPVMERYSAGLFLSEGEFETAFKACPWIK